jgi:hypothetical protein
LEIYRKLQQQLQEDPNFLSKVGTGSIPLLSLPHDENQVEGAKIEGFQRETQTALNTLRKKHLQDAFQK